MRNWELTVVDSVIVVGLVLAALFLCSGCAPNPERNNYERDYQQRWADPCAWEKAGRLERVVRVGRLDFEEDPLDHETFYERVAKREARRCALAR